MTLIKSAMSYASKCRGWLKSIAARHLHHRDRFRYRPLLPINITTLLSASCCWRWRKSLDGDLPSAETFHYLATPFSISARWARSDCVRAASLPMMRVGWPKCRYFALASPCGKRIYAMASLCRCLWRQRRHDALIRRNKLR